MAIVALSRRSPKLPAMPTNLALGSSALAQLIATPSAYLLMVGIGRWLKRRHQVALGWIYHVFCLALAIYVPAWLLEFDLPFLREIGAVAIISASFVASALIKRFGWEVQFSRRRETPVPKIVTDATRLVTFTVAALIVFRVVYDRQIPGLLAGSGIAALILGLALQDLLGNIIAGFAIHFGHPFKAGDWLLVGDRRAQVVEINWRSTRMRTPDDWCLDIPNRELVRQNVINYHYPTPLHSLRITVGVDQTAPPSRVKDVLIHATNNARGVLPAPATRAFLKNFADNHVEYEVQFWIADNAIFNEVTDAVRTNIWYALHRHGLRLALPLRNVRIERPSHTREQEMHATARNILRQQPLFQSLSDPELDALLPRGRLVHFGRSEKLIEQGDDGTSMFILVDGEASVVVERDGEATRVAGLRAGDCFGEMSLLTGQKRSATVLAQTDCDAVEIGKAVLATNLKQKPELLTKLSELLAKRQLENEGVLAHTTPKKDFHAKQSEYTASFLGQLRSFFEL